MAQIVKNLPAMKETWVQSLGWKDPLEEGMVTHSSILAWEIPWTQEPGRLHSMGSQSPTRLSTHTTLMSFIICTDTFHTSVENILKDERHK